MGTQKGKNAEKRRILFSCRNKAVLFFLSLLFLFLAVSCSPEDSAKAGAKKNKRSGSKKVFRKLENYSVALIIMTANRTFLPGSANAKVVFALRNTGHTPLTVKEWRMCESSNLSILYAPGKPEETKKIPLKDWKRSPTYDKNDPYAEIHTPLILHPINNNALIEVPLSFLQDVKNKGRRQYFTIIAELNLTSISAKSEPLLVTVK